MTRGNKRKNYKLWKKYSYKFYNRSGGFNSAKNERYYKMMKKQRNKAVRVYTK